MFEIDGSQKSGSGTILRLAVALAAIKAESLHLTNIRQSRPKPGLRPQHLQAVLTAAKLCNAKTQGATLDSQDLHFEPHELKGGNFNVEIGTAGSIPMLFLTVLPICLYTKQPVTLHVCKGGTDTRQAPTMNYLRYVLLPSLERMGVKAQITVQSYGYYPKGMGEATLTVKPAATLKPFCIEDFGKVTSVEGVSVCTFLSDRQVARRQAEAAEQFLAQKGYKANIHVVDDTSNPLRQKGSSIALWAKTSTGALIGADAIGELGKSSEQVGNQAAEKLCTELSAKATVDDNLADMLIPYVALAQGHSEFLAHKVSGHLDANLWLAERMLGVRFNVNRVQTLYRVQKVG
ncbi:MAG: RNA 3'-terminal phosphate cyclase [Candidatus Bathyarchaeota archaeon]|nr:RNA 3'-terminal phosphate cyclase [Candidatus Bathyarchaeota archaeon]